jgi:hypothetical protein
MTRARDESDEGPATRLPRPADYYTESGLTWAFRPVTTTPAADAAKPGLDVWGWVTKMHNGSGRKVVIVCCALGALGFVPDDVAAEMWKAAEGAERDFCRGFRVSSGFCKLNGHVVERDERGIKVELSFMLHQREGEDVAEVSEKVYESWGIRRELLKDSEG